MRLTTFNGLQPKIDPQDLGPQSATVAENCELYAGRIDPFMSPAFVSRPLGIDGQPFVGEVKTLYAAGGLLIAFDEDISIAPDPSRRGGDESFLFVRGGRLWRSSPAWVVDGHGPVLVGIERPVVAPTAAVVGGGTPRVFPPLSPDGCVPEEPASCAVNADVPDARAYLFTYVTGCGEESAPSPASEIVNVLNGQAVMLVDTNTAPPNAAFRRWYRSVSGSDSRALWLLEAEVPIALPGLRSDMSATSLGEALVTEQHWPPPDCLEGVAVVGDTLTIVWSGRQYWVSEPMLPHAYPRRYNVALPYYIKRMVSITSVPEGGETYPCYVLTDGTPFVISGTLPEALRPSEVPNWLPLAGFHAVSVFEGGVAFATEQALVYMSGASVESILNEPLTDIEWSGFDPRALRLQFWNGRLWGFNDRGGFVYTSSRYRRDRPPQFVRITLAPSAVFSAPGLDLYLAEPSGVYAWGRGDAPMRARWRTKTFTMPGQWWPAAAKVTTGQPQSMRGYAEANWAFAEWRRKNGHKRDCAFFDANPEYQRFEPQLLSMKSNTVITLYADGRPYYSRPVFSDQPFRVPARRRGIDWQIEVSTSVPVREIHVETSIHDLTQLGFGVSNSV